MWVAVKNLGLAVEVLLFAAGNASSLVRGRGKARDDDTGLSSEVSWSSTTGKSAISVTAISRCHHVGHPPASMFLILREA